MSKLSLISVFLEQMRKHLDSDLVVDWYEQFLAKQNFTMELKDGIPHKDLLEICLNLFFLSQKMVNDLVYGIETGNMPMDVVSSLNLFSATDVILHEYLPEDLASALSELFNDALFKFSVPRENESRTLSTAILSFLAQVYIPLNIERIMSGMDYENIESEELFVALFCKKQLRTGLCTKEEFFGAMLCLKTTEEAADAFYKDLDDNRKLLLE